MEDQSPQSNERGQYEINRFQVVNEAEDIVPVSIIGCNLEFCSAATKAHFEGCFRKMPDVKYQRLEKNGATVQS